MKLLRSVSIILVVLILSIFAMAGCSDGDSAGQKTANAIPAKGASPPAAEKQPLEAETADAPGSMGPTVAVAEIETSADAETEEIQTSSKPQQFIVKGVVTQWAPMVLFVKPGDQIVFRQMAGHDSETIEGMIPEGAETWKSKLGQEGFAVSPSVPGIYMYKCNPHVSLGMIGAIAVGNPPYANLDAIEAHPQNKGMIGRAIRKLKQALASHDGA